MLLKSQEGMIPMIVWVYHILGLTVVIRGPRQKPRVWYRDQRNESHPANLTRAPV